MQSSQCPSEGPPNFAAKLAANVASGILLFSLLPLHANAQQTPSPASPAVDAHAAKPALTPEQQAAKDLAIKLRFDWGLLSKFQEDDAALPPPAAGEKRVVFMGDSITQAWLHNGVVVGPKATEPDPGFFPGKPYVNRGISGQTTTQMLLRFRQDVVHLKPSAVVIFAGTNDVAGNTGDMTPEQTEDNLSSMAEIANANGIRVILCSILPAFDFPWHRGREPAPKIIALNKWIQSYAASHGYVYVDFYSAMVDARGGLPPNLSHDGVHPTKAGYDIMNPIVEAGIAKALAGS